MDSKIASAASAYVAPKLMRNFRMRWLVYGAAAYYGLRLLNKQGILPNQTGAALRFIDRGIDMAKDQLGFSRLGGMARSLTSDTSANATLSH